MSEKWGSFLQEIIDRLLVKYMEMCDIMIHRRTIML